ncbi:MAG: hypothetical protein FVQ77_09220 [Cytophagales bacterium]|nr:hypothetical protein [Cytophagales bacterium]
MKPKTNHIIYAIRYVLRALRAALCLLLIVNCSRYLSGSTLNCYSQSLQLIKTIPVKSPDKVSVDRYNNIFVCDGDGNVNKYDTAGNTKLTYSPQKIGSISLIEAWNSVKIFLFYKDFQEYVMLDRFLAPISIYNFDLSSIGFARTATLAADNNLWIIDDSDFSLKKHDIQLQTITIETPLDLLLDARDYDINFMREYQNMLFINDYNSGILVFDNLGNYKKKLPFTRLESFGFLNEELYYLEDNKIHLFHLYNFNTRTIQLPEDKIFINTIVFKNQVCLFSEDYFFIYKQR